MEQMKTLSTVVDMTVPNYLLTCNSKKKTQRVLKPLEFDSYDKSFQSTKKYLKGGCKSKFRQLLKQRYFPFEVDYSKNPRSVTQELSLAWNKSLQAIDVGKLIPELLEGYEDSNPKYHRIVDAAVRDMLRHMSLDILCCTIDVIKAPMKRLLLSTNCETVICALRSLKNILRIVQKIRIVEPKVFRSILIPINNYHIHSRSTVDMSKAVFNSRKELLYVVDKTLAKIETFAGGHKQRWQYAKAMRDAYKGHASKYVPETLVKGEYRQKTRLQKNVSNCCIIRPHVNPFGWRKLNRFALDPNCRDIIKNLPWIVPKNANYYTHPDDIRLIDANIV